MVSLRLAARSKVCRNRVLCCPTTPGLVLPGVSGARGRFRDWGQPQGAHNQHTGQHDRGGRSRQGEVLKRGQRLPFGLVVRAGAGRRVATEQLATGKDAMEAARRVGIAEISSHAPVPPTHTVLLTSQRSLSTRPRTASSSSSSSLTRAVLERRQHRCLCVTAAVALKLLRVREEQRTLQG